MSNYLEHHGVMGMKWGIRRYQPYSLVPRKSGKRGKIVGEAKKVNSGSDAKSKKTKPKGSKKNNKKEQYRPKEAKPKTLSKEAKQDLINSGNLKEITKHANQLSNDELRNAMNRVNLNKQLSEMNSAQINSGKSRVDQIFDTMNSVNDKVNKGIKLYNTGAKIYNSLSEEPLPVLDGTYRKHASAEVKKLIKEGSPDEVLREFEKGNLSVDDMKKANNKFQQKKTMQGYSDYFRERENAPIDKGVKESKSGDNTTETNTEGMVWEEEKKKTGMSKERRQRYLAR